MEQDKVNLHCYQCGQLIHLSSGYRVFNNHLLHDHCYPSYIIILRRAKREAKVEPSRFSNQNK